MPRKASTVAHATVSIAVAPISVATAKRARRAKLGAPLPVAAPAPAAAAPITVDLTHPNARKLLAAAYPAPANDTMIPATEAHEIAAATYIASRERATIESARKDAAGTVLCDAIRGNLGIVGNGWKATWNSKKGDIDWGALVKELNIDAATIDRFRKPASRVIDVREIADDEVRT